MGNPTRNLMPLYQQLDWNPSKSLILEIGSERGEGSTFTLSDIARSVNCQFITVDILDHAKNNTHGTVAEFVVYESGSKWCHDELPNLEKKINILYLDNFDWTWDECNPQEYNLQQRQEYLKRGIVMNNFNCAQEHLAQMLYCLPYMAEKCLIVCDDTWRHPHEGLFVGKCGPTVHYLLHQGFEILHNENLGIILGRNIKQ